MAKRLTDPNQIHYREFRIDEATRAGMDKDKRTIEIAFSSEEPVERWGYVEILDHGNESVDLSRLNNRAAFLLSHNTDDQIGVVESARVDPDRRGRAVVRFGRSARAEEIWQDVQDGIRSLVSVGYHIRNEKIENPNAKKGEPTVYRATRWLPLEVSLVAIPADATVGVGRSAQNNPTKPIQEDTMRILRDADPAIAEGGAPPAPAPAPPPGAQSFLPSQIAAMRNEAAEQERIRITEIRTVAERNNQPGSGLSDFAERCIREGVALADFQRRLPAFLGGKPPVSDPEAAARANIGKEIGMNERDLSRYSIVRAIRGQLPEHKFEGLEKEVSDQYAKEINKPARSFYVPPDVMRASSPFITETQRRQARASGLMIRAGELVAGTGSLGGNIVEDMLLAGSFIEILRARVVLMGMGVGILDGLQGDVLIPRQTGAGVAYWGTEVAAATQGNMTFNQLSLTPKGLTVYQDYSKQLLIQSTPSVETLVRNDIARIAAIAIDTAAISGATAGANPVGILNTTGIGSVAIGTDGGPLTWAKTVDTETEVAIDNADMGSLAYLTNAKVRGKAKQISRDTAAGGFIWGDSIIPARPGDGILNGYRAVVTNTVPSNLTKGTSTTVCSALIFGNWADALFGSWGGLDVLVDPYSGAGTRVVKVYGTQYIDFALRHAESFAAIKDITT